MASRSVAATVFADPISWLQEYYLVVLLVVATLVVVLGLLLAEYVYLNADAYRISVEPVDRPPADAAPLPRSDERLAGLAELESAVAGAVETGEDRSVTIGRARFIDVEDTLAELPVDDEDGGRFYVESDGRPVRVSIRRASDEESSAGE